MIYVHVGFPKVASTTIQRFLSRNETFLAKHGFVYPKLTAPGKAQLGVSTNAHNALAVELRRGRPGGVWQRLTKAREGLKDGQHIVLSGESLGGCKPAALRDALGGPAVIIWYVRDFAHIMTSQYAHATKLGLRTLDFDAFLERTLNRSNYNLVHHLGTFAEVFGAESIKVRMLDERVLARGDVRFDILEAIDVDVSKVEASDLEMTNSANVGLGWKTVEILRDLNASLTKLFVDEEDEDYLTEARRNRHRRQDSPLLDFTSGMSGQAAKIGREMGFTDKGQYLSQEQFDRCNAAFNAQVDALRDTPMKLSVTYAPEESFTPRAFMPSIDAIPPAEVSEFLRRLSPYGYWKLLSDGRRAEFERDEEDA